MIVDEMDKKGRERLEIRMCLLYRISTKERRCSAKHSLPDQVIA